MFTWMRRLFGGSQKKPDIVPYDLEQLGTRFENQAGPPDDDLPVYPDFTNSDVGGIEALSLDGRIYFFGYSYRADCVLSPPISDRELMARYASYYLRQNIDGREAICPVEYWAELVDESLRLSGLFGDDAPLNVTEAELSTFGKAARRPFSHADGRSDLELAGGISVILERLIDGRNGSSSESMEDLLRRNGWPDGLPLMSLDVLIFKLNPRADLEEWETREDYARALSALLVCLPELIPASWHFVFQSLWTTDTGLQHES